MSQNDRASRQKEKEKGQLYLSWKKQMGMRPSRRNWAEGKGR